ncbi:MAG: hypothetical protein NTV22_02225, partial [bacterium]|nr:hypothetical protein [bacterium]
DLTARPRRIAATVTAGADALRLYPPHATWDAAYYTGTNTAPVCRFITHTTRALASVPLRTNASTRVVLTRKNT